MTQPAHVDEHRCSICGSPALVRDGRVVVRAPELVPPIRGHVMRPTRRAPRWSCTTCCAPCPNCKTTAASCREKHERQGLWCCPDCTGTPHPTKEKNDQ